MKIHRDLRISADGAFFFLRGEKKKAGIEMQCRNFRNALLAKPNLCGDTFGVLVKKTKTNKDGRGHEHRRS